MLRSHRFVPVRARRGSALAVLAISLVIIIGVMALALDGGVMMAERRHAQSVSDAAALAASYSLYNNYSKDNGLDPTQKAATAARAIASDNGYTNDGATSTVTVNVPPLSGNFLGKAGYAEVIVQYNQPRLFSAIWGAGTLSVSTRTVARGMLKSSIGLLLLDPTMAGAVSGVGNGTVNVTGGSVIVNSTSSQAGSLKGNATVTASNINFTGNYSTSGNGSFNGTVKTSVTATADPYSSLAAPNPSSLSLQSATGMNYSNGAHTLQPGVYKGGISLSGQASVTLAPGVYYLQGGGLSLSGQSSMSGAGVTIYNAPITSSDQISLTGGGTLSLTPPTSGTYANFSIIQDRNSTAPLQLTGNGGLNVTGIIYAANAAMTLTGNGSSDTFGSQIIADSVSLAGNGTVNIGKTGSAGSNRDTRIVE